MEDFSAPDSADSKEYGEFYYSERIKVRREIILRMRLALVFPSEPEKRSTLKGISFIKDGAYYREMLDYFQKSFRNYSSEKAVENKELKEHFVDPRERKLIFEEASEILLGNKKEGNRVIPVSTTRSSGFVSSEGGHAEGLMTFDNLLMKINRGARSSSQQSGIIVFQKSSETTEAEAYLSTLNENSHLNGDEFDKSIAKIVLPTPLLIIPMKDQKAGNCTLATSKAFVQATYFAVIRKHLKRKHPEENEDSINKKASLIAKSMYKEFSMALRVQEIKNYIETHAAEGFKLADDEILIKMINYAFRSQEAEVLEKIKGNKELCSFIAEEKQKLLPNALKNDDLDFIRFLSTLQPEKFDEKLVEKIVKTAIDSNALKIIHEFETLIGPLKNVKIYGTHHPLPYSIISIINSDSNSDTVIALLKNYSPTPYQEITDAIKTLKMMLNISPLTKKQKDESYHSIETIQEFCSNQLIQELKSEILKILEKEIALQQKIEEIRVLDKQQKAVLEELTMELPSRGQHERNFKAAIDGAIQGIEQDNTVINIRHTQPEVIAPTDEKPKNKNV